MVKKMKKRILSSICVICLLCTLFPTTVFATYIEPTITVSAEYQSEGSKVVAKVSFSAYEDVAALGFRLKYDKTKLTVSGDPVLHPNFTGAVVNKAGDGFVGFSWSDITGSSSSAAIDV